MKRSLNNKNFILFLSLLLTLVFTGVKGFAITAPQTTEPPVKQAPIDSKTDNQAPANTSKKPSIPEKNFNSFKNFEKNSSQNGFVKFLFAMLGVFVSAVTIFAALKLYKRFFLNVSADKNSFENKNSLESPKNFKEAINLFLNKTDK